MTFVIAIMALAGPPLIFFLLWLCWSEKLVRAFRWAATMAAIGLLAVGMAQTLLGPLGGLLP